MPVEGILQVALILATLLSSLAAGLLFAFAVVVMPGIRSLNNREFIRAFHLMDGVIQDGQPLFMLVWIGSTLALLVSVALGIGQLDGIERLLIIAATVAYVLGVQLPTVRINIPLNNQLQTLDVDTMSEAEQGAARAAFEPRWNRWNSIRTAIAILTSALLIILLFRL